MMKKIFAAFIAAFALLSCTSQKQGDADTAQENKVLVLYYSQTGATKTVAEEIQNQLGADIEAIEVETPYDGDFQQTIERCQKEMAENTLPALKPMKANIEDYDVIFLGFPVWFGTYARPIATLVADNAFEGKKIVPFCTFGSGGIEACTEYLKKALPKAEIATGYGVRNARIAAAGKELNRFLIEWEYKKGEIEALPAFMEHKPVTDAEAQIFDEACGDYQFPLGTPADVAIRETEDATEYEFGVVSKGEDGSEAQSTIYVVVGKEDGSKPEFTKVVR